MRILALDIGTRRTGVAYFDDAVGFTLPLETIHHQSKMEFAEKVLSIAAEKKVEKIVVGIPYLPSGEEGSQADIVRDYAAILEEKFEIHFVDERYTTPKRIAPKQGEPQSSDSDQTAAIAILNAFLGC